MRCENGCRLGIMGGSFDPIHYGHLVLAEQIRTQFHLDMVYFVPVGTPSHKKSRKMADKLSRYEMTAMATMTNPYFQVSRIEIDNMDVSYTINTIKEFRKNICHDDTLYFITGADAIIDIETWRSFEELLSLCKFIGATRPTVDDTDLVTKVNHIIHQHNADIQLTTVSALAISSTDIRNRVKNGMSIRYLLPESVEHYIYKKGLYKDSESISINIL